MTRGASLAVLLASLALTSAPVWAQDRVPGRADGVVMADPGAYRIGPLDVIRIAVAAEPGLTGLHVVRPDGMISLPAADANGTADIQAAGRTTGALAAHLGQALGAYRGVSVKVLQRNRKRYRIPRGVLQPSPANPEGSPTENEMKEK